ncbi:hypothetical protein EIN_054490 [Entamoeba invadens IP1]|uniref:hypothetical protein n=1 Tax=Entamoeba invadens IP1 TaxID=370355 RepID=UPI0002C3F4CA|nr:hypothetical protein EIN_054490 [Entamoeba invadens IP1]ELP93164.1 hypothetical protein EIN_054490 [Entamoeba invadens IP1]|eukprot:XP_004259935.1 hypothetical protein EIN_054490 [Entamoeba invadens IP1]
MSSLLDNKYQELFNSSNVLSPDVLFLLKKFQKSNETTLTRTLDELKNLLLDPSFLPTTKEQQAFSLHWSNLFTTLSTHKSSNVRLSLFLCISDGFFASPQGKNILGFSVNDTISWWVLECSDSVKEVATAARNALDKFSIEGRQRIVTQNTTKILRLITVEEYDVVSRIGCLSTLLPNLDVEKLSEFSLENLKRAIEILINSHGSVPDEIYFSSVTAALNPCKDEVLKKKDVLITIVSKSLEEIQSFSKSSKQLIECIVTLLECGVDLPNTLKKSLIGYISTACLGTLHVFPVLKRLLPFMKKTSEEYIEAVEKGCFDNRIRGAQRAVVIVHLFDAFSAFQCEKIQVLLRLEKNLLDDPQATLCESGYSALGVFLNKLNETQEIQGVLSNVVTMIRHCEEKEYETRIKNLEFIVQNSVRNEFTQGFSNDLLRTMIEKNSEDAQFNLPEIELFKIILKVFPATEDVFEMITRQFQHIFMFIVEQNVNEIDLILDTVEIDDQFLPYVKHMEEILVLALRYMPSCDVSHLLKKCFFSLFPENFGTNHLIYLDEMFTLLKTEKVTQTIVLDIESVIPILLRNFRESKSVLDHIIQEPCLLTPLQLDNVISTATLDHIQIFFTQSFVDFVMKHNDYSLSIFTKVLTIATNPIIFNLTYQNLRNNLTLLLPKIIAIVGENQVETMIEKLMEVNTSNVFILSICAQIEEVKQHCIKVCKKLEKSKWDVEKIRQCAAFIQSPLLIPQPEVFNETSRPQYNHIISLVVSLFELCEHPLSDEQYMQFYLLDVYQKLTFSNVIAPPKASQLETIKFFLGQSQLEQFILFHGINIMSKWFNQSQEAIDYIAQTFDKSDDYTSRFFFSSYLSTLHVEWLEKKITSTIKKFFMANVKPDGVGLKELSVIYPLVQFPSHLSVLFKYIFNVSITQELYLPFLQILKYCFSSSCTLCYETIQDIDTLSGVYQFLIEILEKETGMMIRSALQISQILITHNFPSKLNTSETEAIQLSFKMSLIEYITERILKRENVQLLSEILLQTDLLSEIDFLGTTLPEKVEQLLEVVKTENETISTKMCCGYLLGAAMEFKAEEAYIDMDDVEKMNYKPMNEKMEKYMVDGFGRFKNKKPYEKVGIILFVLGMMRRIKDTSVESRPWVVAYLQLHKFEVFLSGLYCLLTDEPTSKSLGEVLGKIQTESEEESIGSLGMYCMFTVVETLPNLVRQWCLSLKRNAPKMVKKFFGKNICPAVLEEEVQKILSWKEDENFMLKMQLDGKAVTVKYRNDDLTFESQLIFPDTYPLDIVSVNVNTNAVGVGQAKAHLYKRMLTLNLMTRDVGIVGACLLWKNQLDRQFDSSDACPICYSIFYLHTTTIPNVACKCCRRKFHKQCIFTWFRSTGRNDCPLCTRNFYGESTPTSNTANQK